MAGEAQLRLVVLVLQAQFEHVLARYEHSP